MADATVTIAFKTEPAQPLTLVIKQLEEVEKQAKDASTAFDDISAAAGKIGAAFAGFALLKGGFDFVLDAAKNTELLTKQFLQFTGSAELAAEQLEALSSIPGPSLNELAAANRTLLAFGVSLGNSVEQLRQLNDVAAGTGANITDLADIFGKIQDEGNLTTETFKKLSNQIPGFASVLSDALEIPQRSLKKLAAEGKITSDQVIQSLQKITSEGGQFFGASASQAATLTGSLSALNDSFAALASVIGSKATPVTSGWLDVIRAATDAVTEYVKEQDKIASDPIAKRMSELDTRLKDTEKVFRNLNDIVNMPDGFLKTIAALPFNGLDGVNSQIETIGKSLKVLNDERNGIIDGVKALELFNANKIEQEKITKNLQDEMEKRDAVIDADKNKQIADIAKNANARAAAFTAIEKQITTIQAQEEALRSLQSQEAAKEDNELAVKILAERQAALSEALVAAEVQKAELLDQFDQAEILRMKGKQDAITAATKKGEADRLAVIRTNQNDQFNLIKATKDAQVTFDEQTYAERVSTAQKGLNALVSLQNNKSHEAFEIGKAAALVQAGISIPLTAIEAYKSLAGIPVVGPVLGAAAAAAAIIAGTEQLRKIQAQRFAEGGMVQGVGGKDTIPILATAGETIVPAKNFDQLQESWAAGAAASDQINLTRQTNDILIRILDQLTIGVVNEKLTSMISILGRINEGIGDIAIAASRSHDTSLEERTKEMNQNQPKPNGGFNTPTATGGGGSQGGSTASQLERLRNRLPVGRGF